MDMAPAVAPEPRQPPAGPPRHNLRNPLPLSAAQESEVRVLYYQRVRSRCAPEIKQFADCARGRTISVAWSCRAQHLAMNSCMIQHATKAEEDAAREEWFSGILERRQKKDDDLAAVELRRHEVIELTKRQEEKEKAELEKKLADQKPQQAESKKRSSWWQ